MTYLEKLQDVRWQKKRLEILQRDNWRCTICEDDTTTLHVHHLKYKGNPWEIENEFLTTLCKHCHLKLEQLIKDFDFTDALESLCYYFIEQLQIQQDIEDNLYKNYNYFNGIQEINETNELKQVKKTINNICSILNIGPEEVFVKENNR